MTIAFEHIASYRPTTVPDYATCGCYDVICDSGSIYVFDQYSGLVVKNFDTVEEACIWAEQKADAYDLEVATKDGRGILTPCTDHKDAGGGFCAYCDEPVPKTH